MPPVSSLIENLKILANEIYQGNLIAVVELKRLLHRLREDLREKPEGEELLNRIQDAIKQPETLISLIPKLETLISRSEDLLPEEKNTMEEDALQRENRKTYFRNIVNDVNLLRKFYYEAKEHLESMQSLLIEIEFDPKNQELLHTLFRNIHTIKGSAGFLGLKNFEEISHVMEEILAKARDGKIYLRKEIIDIIFLGVKLLQTLLDILYFEVESREFSIDNLIKEFQNIEIYSYINFLKDISSKLEYKKIGEILQEEGKIRLEELERLLEKQVKEYEPLGTLALKEGLLNKEDLEEVLQKQQKLKRKIAESYYVKVANTKLNSLVDLVGELVINQSILRQELENMKNTYKLEFSDKTLQRLESITSTVKNIVLTLGMLPVRELYNKLKVAARNVAKELGKILVLETYGEDVEIDRSVIEILYEPLLHIIRNAIDHGIESPEDRVKLNKPKAGKIQLKAENKGSEIWITVQDDGRGIQKQKIMEKAIQKGIIDKNQAESLTEKQIYELMFIPGISTKENISAISGRGVGLDVVKKGIESIHGKLEIESKEGSYTKFILKIPLTLAIIDGFVVKVLENRYVFPFAFVEEVYIFHEYEVLYEGKKVIRRRDEVVMVVFLEEILFRKKIYPQREIYQSLLLRYEGVLYCVVVEEIIGKQEIVIRNLGGFVRNKLFSGGTIFGDGSIGFVIDIENFVKSIS